MPTDARPGDEHGLVDVDVVTVDGVLSARQIPPGDVGMLWLDVQGHEGHVLAGAPEALRAAPPLVFAARSRKMTRAGEYDSMLDAIIRTYASVVDLRPAPGSAAWTATVRPTSELEQLLAERKTTDLLAFNPG
jgi:hypothetical protein